MELEYFYIKIVVSLIGLLSFVFLLRQSDLKKERRSSNIDNTRRIGKERLYDVSENDPRQDERRFIDRQYEVDMAKKSHDELDLVRADISLLERVRFRDIPGEDRCTERLRLCIAIYNDLRSSDFEIVKRLFIETIEWRKSQVPGDPDHFYFCAYLLSLFENPESIWLFDQAKHIDFDSSCGFDDEHYLSFGVKKTIQYLKRGLP